MTHPLIAAFPSVAIDAQVTQEEWPFKDATAPEPGFPLDEVLTSCNTNRLSSEAESKSYIELG